MPGVQGDVQAVTHALAKHGFHVMVVMDPTVAELEEALKLIPARTKLLRVDGAGHDLNFGKHALEGAKDNLPQSILAAFQPFFS